MVLMGMTKRSDQQIALGRRPTWICRIGRLCIAAEVPENPFDDGRILNARDHLKLPAAAPADLNVGRSSVCLLLGYVAWDKASDW